MRGFLQVMFEMQTYLRTSVWHTGKKGIVMILQLITKERIKESSIVLK